MPDTKCLIGCQFGKLKVIKKADPYIAPSGYKAQRYVCLCECGNEKTFPMCALTRAYNAVKSCGCINKENAVASSFWDHVEKCDDGCWRWKLGKKGGYGVLFVNGKQIRAHRHAWELVNGPIPDGLWVLHKCDHPECVRPEHLFLGNQEDNMQDALKKGRLKCGETFKYLWKTKWKDNKGSNSPLAGENSITHKLTSEKVIEMRRLHEKEGWGYKRLHRHFRVGITTCRNIVLRISWQNI